jgi:type II secretory pathway pseudopilin PulG
MPNTTPRRRRKPNGYILLGMYTMIMVMAIMTGAGMREWSILEKREREAQLIFIQEQYAAAALRYQTKQGALPPDLDVLTKALGDGSYALRKAYTDPITRAKSLADWCLLRVGGAGRIVSSCSAEGQVDNNLGLGTSQGFKPGEEAQPIRADRQTPGVAPGGVGVVGVHSKSSDRAYNTMKREEETYDRWYYTIEEFKNEISLRVIPGLSQQGQPGQQQNIPGSNPQGQRPPGNRGGGNN